VGGVTCERELLHCTAVNPMRIESSESTFVRGNTPAELFPVGWAAAMMMDGAPPRGLRRDRYIKSLKRQLLNMRLDRWGVVLLILCGTWLATTVLTIVPQVGSPRLYRPSAALMDGTCLSWGPPQIDSLLYERTRNTLLISNAYSDLARLSVHWRES
jgi:hypothetical protein